MALAGDLVFFHGFKQRALGFGRGAVDLVGEHELREYRAMMECKALGVRLIDGHAENVGRQQVAGELDTLELKPQGLRQHLRQRGLAHARQVLDQQVPAREQAGKRQARLALLAEHHLADAFNDGVEGTPRRCGLSFGGQGHVSVY